MSRGYIHISAHTAKTFRNEIVGVLWYIENEAKGTCYNKQEILPGVMRYYWDGEGIPTGEFKAVVQDVVEGVICVHLVEIDEDVQEPPLFG